MIHRKLHYFRCGTRNITFIYYGPCKPPPSEIPAVGELTLISSMQSSNPLKLNRRACLD